MIRAILAAEELVAFRLSRLFGTYFPLFLISKKWMAFTSAIVIIFIMGLVFFQNLYNQQLNTLSTPHSGKSSLTEEAPKRPALEPKNASEIHTNNADVDNIALKNFGIFASIFGICSSSIIGVLTILFLYRKDRRDNMHTESELQKRSLEIEKLKAEIQKLRKENSDFMKK